MQSSLVSLPSPPLRPLQASRNPLEPDLSRSFPLFGFLAIACPLKMLFRYPFLFITPRLGLYDFGWFRLDGSGYSNPPNRSLETWRLCKTRRSFTRLDSITSKRYRVEMDTHPSTKTSLTWRTYIDSVNVSSEQIQCE